MLTKHIEEKARQELHKNILSHIEHILEATPNDTTAVQPFTSHLKNHSRQTGHCWRSKDEHTSDVHP